MGPGDPAHGLAKRNMAQIVLRSWWQPRRQTEVTDVVFLRGHEEAPSGLQAVDNSAKPWLY